MKPFLGSTNTDSSERQNFDAPSRLARAKHQPRRTLGWVALLGLCWGVAAGCEGGRLPPAGTDMSLPPQQVASTGRACTAGETRECSATLAIHDGTLSCYQGTQSCETTGWGSCIGSSIVERPAPPDDPGARLRLLAYGAASACASNPCDPFCQGFSEVPPDPLVAGEGATTGYSWQTGSVSSPNAELAAGIEEPCMSGSDCQFNQHCTDVMTNSACGHSKCTTGGALVPACDDCVGDICEINPECCQRGWSCDHDLCATGTKLASNCDDGNPAGSCVSQVCAVDSSCCSSSWDEDCVARAQSLCGLDCGSCGAGEVKYGSSCYYLNTSNKTWSSARTACRDRGAGWDLVTISSSGENSFVEGELVGSTWTGIYKNSGSWKWSNGASNSYDNWGWGEPDSEQCARMSTSGTWSDVSCSSTYDSFCEGPGPASSGSTRTWSQDCVDAVEKVCDATCDTGSPPSEAGQCSTWRPGDTDANCPTSPDLSLGVPCDSGVVPVCNHGGAAAAAGVTVDYYTTASGVFPSCAPSATPKGSCSATTTPIPPGECVNVTCPTTGASGLADGDRLVVNRGKTVSECSCLDNWSVYGTGVTCGAPTCEGTSTESSFKPVRMFIVVDRSYSMVCHPPSYPASCISENGTTCKCTGQRWAGATSALKAYFQNANTAGIGIAMDFFPLTAGSGAGDGCAGGAALGSTTSSSACGVTACKNPLVSLGYLTAAASPTDTQEQLLVTALTTSPVSPPKTTDSSTPSYPALKGALEWAKAEQLAKPNETFIVVFVTDGEPSTCLVSGDSFGNTPRTNAALVDLAKDAYDSSGVRTYTLGMEGSSVTILDQIAAAGGTTKSFVVGGSNATDISTALTAALDAISGESASCTLPYTASDDADPASAVVTYTSGTSTTTITKRSGLTACDSSGGWYYNNAANPTQVILCPSTCTTVQADSAASVKLDVPCAAELEPAVYTQKYQTNCSDAQYPLWQFLTYDTTNPEGGQVQFRLRTAATEAALASATWVDAKTATQTAPDCQAGMSGCPVDLVTLLGDHSSDPNLELEITVTPTSLGETPSANSWQVTFTCPFNQ
jgi:hypothetical protein